MYILQMQGGYYDIADSTFWKVLNLSSGSDRSFSRWIWLVKIVFKEQNMAFYCASFPSKCYILEIQKVIHAHSFQWISSPPMFQDPTDKSHFNLKMCPQNYHKQHGVKCTLNNPFIGWEVKD